MPLYVLKYRRHDKNIFTVHASLQGKKYYSLLVFNHEPLKKIFHKYEPTKPYSTILKIVPTKRKNKPILKNQTTYAD